MIRFPHLRQELIETLQTLADSEYQQQAWVERNVPKGMEDSFDIAIHFLYDDTHLADNPEITVGLILEKSEEVPLIKALIEALDHVFEALGLEATDEEYINCPQWEQVLRTAKVALLVINKNKRQSVLLYQDNKNVAIK
ncbi:MAG: hypothetical protein HC877_17930 [Thioploca sp.]|nr:hypothetical protein [Thioploca sp.]